VSVLNAVLDAARSGPVERTLVSAAVVIDMSAEVEKDADFLVSPECARWLAEESPLTGLGVEAVGGCRSAVAGAAASFERAAHDRVLALVER
jgi:hypothetical protein